jgi:Uma2 family endonuclease
MVALRKRLTDRLTAAEFLVWDSGDRSGRRWQLRDGVPEAMAPTTRPHGAIQSELARLIGNHVLAAGDRCHVISEPGITPRVRSAENVRIPDLAVTCTPPSAERLVSEPVLVIEILSPSNAEETWENVWAYTTIPSVTEILVISSTAIEAELLRREPDGSWPPAATLIGLGDMLQLDSIAMSLPLSAPYRTSGVG